MSRNYRGHVHTNRWGRSNIGEKKKKSRKELLAYFDRIVKRMTKATEAKPGPFTWHYSYLGEAGGVVAQTRSEARARIKEERGVNTTVGYDIWKGEEYVGE